MTTLENQKIVSYKINENFSNLFDELVNIKLSNRKNDVGFSDFDKMMIHMRDGTTRVGNQHSGGVGTSTQFFWTDFLRNRHHIKGYNNRVWYLSSLNVWTDLGVNFTGNDFFFKSVRLPINLTGTTSTEYTTPSLASASEKVVKSVSDTTTNPIGQTLIITDDPNNNQAYRGCFATIIDYDSVKIEYTLGGSGIITALKAGAKYQIYTNTGEYLQVMNGVALDRYFFGKSDGTIVENTSFQGFATLSLRNVKALTSTQYIEKQVSFNAYQWTYNKGTLFYSAGSLNNPFFYNFTGVATIPGISGDIKDIFVFKNRLIIGGNNFIALINKDLTVDIISSSYGMVKGSINDLGVDAYYLSTDKQIYSLSENIKGALVATNVGKQMNNYIKDFNINVCSGFDGRKLYMYGEKDSSTVGTMIVLDVSYKYWSVYTGLRPSSIVCENGITYLSANNSDAISYFDSTVFTDLGVAIEQKISIKEVDLSDVFSTKTLTDMYFWFDNYTQELYVDTYMALPSANGRKNRTTLDYTQVDVAGSSPELGEGELGDGILGGLGFETNISYPYLKHIQLESDNACLWKIIITGKDGSPFYLNEFGFLIGFYGEQRTYFSNNDTQ